MKPNKICQGCTFNHPLMCSGIFKKRKTCKDFECKSKVHGVNDPHMEK